MPSLLHRLLLSATLLTACAAAVPADAQVSLFSAGYLTPENITVAPGSFGTFGGQYFINDAGRGDPTKSQIYTLPISGGSPTSFATNLPGFATGALFLPSSGWGSNSGHYLTVGASNTAGAASQIVAYDAAATPTTLYSTGSSAYFAQAAIAPSNFGANAGKLIVSDEFHGLFAFDSGANVTSLAGANGIRPFAVTFAPSGFGNFGGTLFTDNTNGGQIQSIDANGNVTTFTTIALKQGQAGLRQISFAPSGFFSGLDEPLLLVSVSGSQFGGGVLGDLLAFDATGAQVASLRTDLGLTKFDPRGMYFLNNGTMLVNDSSDPVLLITPNAFVVVPEPSTLALLLTSSVIGAGFILRRRQRETRPI